MDSVTNEQLTELKERFDDVVLKVLGPVRLHKVIDADAVAELKSVLDGFKSVLGGEDYVPRKLVGELWFVVTSLLAEAGHAKNPQPIIDETWDIIDRLERIFGPNW